MKTKWIHWLEKWGYALMCVLCAAVILCSALWTRSAQREEQLSKPSHQSTDESLQDAMERNENAVFLRPCEGKLLRPYTENMVLFENMGVYSAHPAVDLLAPEGTEIIAMQQGTVLSAENGQVIMQHGEKRCIYRGMGTILCETGQTLSAGGRIGLAGGHVPFEGEGHVCIMLLNADGEKENAALYFDE